MDEFVDCATAAKMLGTTKRTVQRWAKVGKIKGERRNKGRSLFVKRQSILPYMPGVSVVAMPEQKKKEEKEAPSISPEQNNFSSDIPIQERQIIAGQNLDRAEAERIIKQEDAIKRQRENLVAEQKLVDKEKVGKALEEAIKTFFVALLQEQEELIDKWGVEYNHSAEKTEEMVRSYRFTVNNCWRKIKNKVFECADISKR